MVDKLVMVICRYEVLMDLLIEQKYLSLDKEKITELKKEIFGGEND